MPNSSLVRAGLWVFEGEPYTGSSAADVTGQIPGAVLRQAGLSDARGISLVAGTPQALIEQRLAAGRRCYLALIGGRPAAYGWLSAQVEAIPELAAYAAPGPGEGYVWDCFTAPDYRGRGQMPALLGQITRDLATLKLKRAWTVILAENKASRRAFRKGGFRPVADVASYKRGCNRELEISVSAGDRLGADAGRILSVEHLPG